MTAEPPVPRPKTSQSGRLSFAIFALARAHRALAAQLLRDFGLHPGQELLLMHLLDRDGQTQKELIAAVGLDHSTVSKSIKRMEDAGLLERRTADWDKRVTEVHLTPAGEAMRERLEAMWAELEQRSTVGLDSDEIEGFVATAERIERSLDIRG